jgi:small subunit ribosomal protein S1
LAKADGGFLAADTKAPFKVIEFNRNEKKIFVSHARIWEDETKEVIEAQKSEKKAEREQTATKVKEIQKSVGKSTFGDLDALTNLKEKLDGDTKKAKAKKDSNEEGKE